MTVDSLSDFNDKTNSFSDKSDCDNSSKELEAKVQNEFNSQIKLGVSIPHDVNSNQLISPVNVPLATNEQKEAVVFSKTIPSLKEIVEIKPEHIEHKMKPIDWESRKDKLLPLIEQTWQNLLDYRGRRKIKDVLGEEKCRQIVNEKGGITCPKLRLKNGCEAEANIVNWEVEMGKMWLLQESDLPLNYNKMNVSQLQIYIVAILEDRELSKDEKELLIVLKDCPNVLFRDATLVRFLKSRKITQDQYEKIQSFEKKVGVETVALFVNLIKANQWTIARKGVFAHELAHLSGSLVNPFIKDNIAKIVEKQIAAENPPEYVVTEEEIIQALKSENKFWVRTFEKEADLVAAHLPDEEIRKGLVIYLQAMLELSSKAQKRETSIIEQDSNDSHPTHATRIAYLSSPDSLSILT